MDKVYETLQYTSSARTDRQKAADLILHYPERLPELLNHCFSNEKDISHRACWVLEFVCHRHIEWILPYLDIFLEGIKSLENESSIRPMAKICEIIARMNNDEDSSMKGKVSPEQIQRIVTQCFDWLVGNHKVAPKAYSMQALYYLKDTAPWIAPQLRQVLLEQREDHSAAYKARSKNLLERL